MSLYYDAVTILDSSAEQKGSLKSLIYAQNSALKSRPAHIYALISEVAKYDAFVKEIVDNAGILALEPKLTPLLALLLVHDYFFAKSGIAAASGHPLRQCIEKNKARLKAEFTRSRLRRKAANVDQLKKILSIEKGSLARASPRWARVNLVKVKCDEVLRSSFAQHEVVDSVEDVVKANWGQNILHIDRHIPDLIAFPPDQDLTRHPTYTEGKIILQDKASCFPAHLLLGGVTHEKIGDVIDACAAPGNKTTHAAAILSASHGGSMIYGCERDPTRSKTLQAMVQKAGANNIVTVLEKQDFLALNPDDERFAKVTHLLLDPSCSGSGIVGREDIPKLMLPEDTRHPRDGKTTKHHLNEKKRKREFGGSSETIAKEALEAESTHEAQPLAVNKARLQKLSNLQCMIVEHAFRFPAARRVTYSTCSINEEENECVVSRVLRSEIAMRRGWRVLRRDEQVEGMKIWKHRGAEATMTNSGQPSHLLDDAELEACIRCSPGDAEGTMGFFVCGFDRDAGVDGATRELNQDTDGGQDLEEWEGFSDN